LARPPDEGRRQPCRQIQSRSDRFADGFPVGGEALQTSTEELTRLWVDVLDLKPFGLHAIRIISLFFERIVGVGLVWVNQSKAAQ